MFERYSEQARRVIFFARYEASQFGSPAIDTQHLLLGILRESQDLLDSVSPSAQADTIRERVQQQSPVRDKIPTSIDLPLSESAKGALNAAADEADQEDSRTISVRHILLGLLREKNSLAQRILEEMGITLEGSRKIAASWREERPGSHTFNLAVATGKAAPNEEFQKVVSDAIEEASRLLSMSARPEHLLLALLRNEGFLAAKILRDAGLDRASVLRRLAGN